MLIRNFDQSDDAAIARICFSTGYLGDSAEGHFKDVELFAMLFARPNLRFDPGSCFVAENEGEVVGYCLVAKDTTLYKQWFAKRYQAEIVRHLLTRTLWRYPRDVLEVVRWARAAPPVDLLRIIRDYPAHLHINVKPGMQRGGIGQALMGEAMRCLRTQGVSAVHLWTSSRNVGALQFYAKLGFNTLTTHSANMWRVPNVHSICMGKMIP